MTPSAPASRGDAVPLTERVLPAQRKALLHALGAEQDLIAELQCTIEELIGLVDGDSIVEREIAERSRVAALERITDIHGALNRIDAGVYGTCERCGGLIATARLEAIPYARHCVDCPAPAPRIIG